MKITEKCKVIVASSLVAALMTGTALPALAASPAGDVPFAVLAQQNSAVTPEQVEALISQIGTVTRSRRAAIVAALDAYNQLDDAGKAAVTNFGVLAEAQQILGIQDALRFLYKGIIIKHNKTEPTYTKTSLFLCEKRRFFMARTEKGVVTTI